MGPIKAVGHCYKRMLNFTGRARRAEYWWFFAWQVLAGAAFLAWVGTLVFRRAQVDPIFATALQNPEQVEAALNSVMVPYAMPLAIANLVLFMIPNLSVTIRRLHDTDRSGWNIFFPTLVSFAAMAGGGFMMIGAAASGSQGGIALAVAVMIIPSLAACIAFLVWLCLPGTRGPNRFGDDPVKDRKAAEPAHPAFAAELHGEERSRAEIARRAAARDYYKRRVLPSIAKA